MKEEVKGRNLNIKTYKETKATDKRQNKTYFQNTYRRETKKNKDVKENNKTKILKNRKDEQRKNWQTNKCITRPLDK